LQDLPGGIGEHDSAWHFVLGQCVRNLDGMSTLIDVIFSEKGDFFSEPCTIIQHQDQRLVTERHGGKDIQEEISELTFARNPGR